MKKIIILLLLFLTLCACTNEETICTKDHNDLKGSVSYLGPEGTYTEEATELFFESNGNYIPYKTVSSAIDALMNDESQYAVIPQENTLGGPVYDYVDELLSHPELAIIGEVELPIRQAFLIKEGASLEEIEIVYSHIQGIIQGAAWLSEHLPNAKVQEVSSTAEGAKMVSESLTSNVAAIASTGAAKVYGLEVYAESIQLNDDNQTRFFILSKEEACRENHERLVFSAEGDASNLSALLNVLYEEEIEIIYLHDRPLKTVLGEYIYLFECSDMTYEDYEKILKLEGFKYHYYGAFDVLKG